jgi:hypothetical protein
MGDSGCRIKHSATLWKRQVQKGGGIFFTDKMPKADISTEGIRIMYPESRISFFLLFFQWII